LRRNLFVSASLEVFQEAQQVIRYWFARDLIEHRTDVTADMSLQVGRQSGVELSPERGIICRNAAIGGGAALD
jgi:hypothetical protein